MMKYGITDIAAVLGVTTSAVRYFEKENLIRVEKDSSGRRYYDEEDAFRLLSYMKYRSMDFSVKDIAYQFSGMENDWKKILDRETDARNHARERAAYYTKLAESIDDHIHGIEQIGELLDRYEFAKSPAVLFAQDQKDGWLSVESDTQQLLHQWVSHMPQVKLGLMRSCGFPAEQAEISSFPPTAGRTGIPEAALPHAGDPSCHLEEAASPAVSPFGFLIRKDSDLTDSLPRKGLMAVGIPSFSALHTVVKASESFAYEPLACFAESMTYARSRGLITDGHAWGRILAVEVEKGQRLHTYVELWIPVS